MSFRLGRRQISTRSETSRSRRGEQQAEDYIRLLVGAIEMVAANPRRARPCDEVRKGYHRYLAGSHIIFFRKIKSGIDVIRILHGGMDFEQHL